MPDTNETRFTSEQINVASRDLRDAAGAPERTTKAIAPDQSFNIEQTVNLLSSEVRLLRERGFTDDRIADLFTASEIEVSPEQIAHFYKPNESFEDFA